MKKRAFFILGGEGTGTYMMRDVLAKAGCHWNSLHDSELVLEYIHTLPSPFVFRRSLPHAGKWPNVDQIARALQQDFDELYVVFMIREYHSAIASVKNRDPSRDNNNLHRDYMFALTTLSNLPKFQYNHNIIVIPYGYFCVSEPYRRWLFANRFKLPYPEDFEIFDANAKYFTEE